MIGLSLQALSRQEIEQAIADELAQPKYRLGAPWWTRLIDFLERAWVRFIEWVTEISELVGGPIVLAVLVGGAVLVTAAVVSANLGRRRARLIEEHLRRERQAARGLDPTDLERQAARAEADGDYATAMRLLFQASLLRLDRQGLIELHPGSTSGLLTDTLHSPNFERVARRFDEVVYGGRPAGPEDPAMVREMSAGLLTGSRT